MGRVLEARGISKRFGGLRALADVDVDVGEWEIVGLIGPNGAGKTTFFDCLTGIQRPDAGTVRYRGTDITSLPTHKRVARGLGRSWQNLGVAREMTVLDNMLMAQHAHVAYGPIPGIVGAPGTFAEERNVRRNAHEILEFMDLRAVEHEQVGSLPYGTQKLVDVAMTLATDPDTLLLDEPSSGMGPDEAQTLAETLRFLRDSLGLTILMIEHHVPLVVGVCDYVYVLNFGRVLTEGEPLAVQRHPEVISAYLGEEDVDGAA